jgi:hypothetical protein
MEPDSGRSRQIVFSCKEQLIFSVPVIVDHKDRPYNPFLQRKLPQHTACRIYQIGIVSRILDEYLLCAGIMVGEKEGLYGGCGIKKCFPLRCRLFHYELFIANRQVVVYHAVYRCQLISDRLDLIQYVPVGYQVTCQFISQENGEVVKAP